ncbi:chromosome partitioning protein [Nocardia nova]|uniref:Chromosome partitioning protein n=1 Tax=Nocardia nova TaxID=37330 RepID=A0A2S6AB48_9NOCA|nr:ParA family protein [Nocardia nova]PPI99067.1 chromosome partitioning protein [Nocardia nova]PPJ03582.1 chromosome partitioning protein [Nocardia nova]PPJ30715.1 chromosome partitioning protein [Nocardia nova]
MEALGLVELRSETLSGQRTESVEVVGPVDAAQPANAATGDEDGFDWLGRTRAGRVLRLERPQRIWEGERTPGRSRPYVVATFNLKGGVGKTTTTAALAEILSAEFDKRVLLIDLDPQANLTAMMVGENRSVELDSAGQTLAAIFAAALAGRPAPDVRPLIQHEVSPMHAVTTVDLLPASPKLIALQDEMPALRHGEPTTVLARALSGVLEDYDYVLVDCPPNLGPITQNGLRLSDGYMIPTIPDIMSTYGIPPVQAHLRHLAARWGDPLEELGVVVTKYRRSSAVHRTTLEILQANRTLPRLFPTRIPDSNQIAAAAAFTDFGSLRRKYGTGGQFLALRELTADFLATTRITLAWGR